MIEINLLPHREAKRAADLRESIALLVLGIVTIVGGAMFLSDQVDEQIELAQTSVSQLENDIEHYRPQEQQVAMFKDKKSELEDKLEVIKGLERARTGPVRMFDELAMHTPERLWITDLSTSGGRIKLIGNSLDNGVVADFLRGLNSSEYFDNVDLLKTGRGQSVNGVRLVRFEVSADLVTPAEEEDEAEDAQSQLAGL
jgi:type IV pilus assembly protein PilN